MSGGRSIRSAIKRGDAELALQLLHESSVGLDNSDKYKRTPLIYAARKGYAEVVRELVRAGAALDLQDMWGSTALILAVDNGHIEVVKELVRAGAKLDLQDTYQETALIVAVRDGHMEVVRELVRASAALDLQDWQYKTALMHAVCNEMRDGTEVVKELVRAGAALDVENDEGKTALSMSSTTGVIRELLEAGAKLGSKGTASALLQKMMHQHDGVRLKRVIAQPTLDWKGDVVTKIAKKHQKMDTATRNRNATILGRLGIVEQNWFR